MILGFFGFLLFYRRPADRCDRRARLMIVKIAHRKCVAFRPISISNYLTLLIIKLIKVTLLK